MPKCKKSPAAIPETDCGGEGACWGSGAKLQPPAPEACGHPEEGAESHRWQVAGGPGIGDMLEQGVPLGILAQRWC